VAESAGVARPFVFAWHFLTAIPLSRVHHDPTAAELASSMAWYSTVGLLIGGLLVAVDQGLSLLFAPVVANALLIVLLVLVTRGLHQDGLADTLDGLAGGKTPEDRLRIMRDPRVGALGATGLFLSLLLRYAALMALPQPIWVPMLFCAPALGRWAMVTLALSMPYARSGGGLAAPFLQHLSLSHVLWSSLVLALALAAGLGFPIALATVTVGLALLGLLRQTFLRWFGGVTGDLLGATNEVVEILFLLLVPLMVPVR